MSTPRDTRVIVIGAGLAGLAAAWDLRAAGCDVTLIERSGLVGGRAAGARIQGFGIERCLNLLRSNDRHLPGFIRAVGVADELLPLRPVVLSQLYRGSVAPISHATPREIGRIAGVRRRHAARLLRLPRLMRRYRPLLDRDAPERASDWDFRSVADFARLYFGNSVYERWIGPAAACAALGDAEQLSRVVFLLEWLAEEGGRVGVARRGLAELPAVAAEKLGARLRVEAARVAAAGSGGYEVQCRDGSALHADAVVMATSGPGAGRIAASALQPAEHDFFASLRSGPEVVLAAALHRAPAASPQLVRVPAAEGEVLASMLVEPGVDDGRAPLGNGLVTAVASQGFCDSGAGASDEVVRKELVAAVERIHPSVVGTFRFTRLFRNEHSVPRFEVGAYRALARFRRVQEDRRALGRRLYFAGDYLSGLSADQVVGSGQRAARDLLSDLAG